MTNNKYPVDSHFLSQLQQEAALQSKLYESPLLPKQLDRFTAIIGNYPWQSILICSGILAGLTEGLRHWVW